MKKEKINFNEWIENITVSLWGAGKATLVHKEQCLDDKLTGNQNYKGACDECSWFMGCHIDGNPSWGDLRKGCCWLQIKKGDL